MGLPQPPLPPQPRKQKILIFNCKGGYGHMAACTTLKNVLTDYDVQIIIPLEDTLGSIDIFKNITFGKVSCEEFYNACLQNNWIRTINLLFWNGGPWITSLNSNRIQRRFYKLFQKEKPDLIISVMPIINYAASQAAAQCNIPYLCITLDADLKLWLIDLEKNKYPHVTFTASILTSHITKQLERKKIPTKSIKEVGFTLRSDFFQPKDTDKIKDEWKVPAGKPIIMMMMGGAGSTQILRFTRQLAKLDIPAHLLVCVGRNDGMIPKLKRIKLNPNISMTTVGFTTKVADLMAISNLFICKPGPNQCNEAMHSGLPILIDQTIPCLVWERATIDLVKTYGKGDIVKKLRKLNPLVKKYLAQKTPRFKHPKLTAMPRFETSIKRLVKNILTKKDSKKDSIVKTANRNIVKPTKTCQSNPQVSKSIAQNGQRNANNGQHACHHTHVNADRQKNVNQKA